MKHHFTARAVAVLLLVAALTLPTGALTHSYAITGAYRDSAYHKNLLNLTRTGDPAFDAVAVALSQLYYNEGNSSADLHGGNASGSGNYTEYNRAYGKVGGTYSYAWCATFVSWCLDAAGAPNSAGGKFASCTLWVEQLRSLGQYSTRASGYTPKTGDLVFFRSAGVTRASDHVGLVRYVKGGRVYTVEGNSSDRVSLRDYSLKDTYIVGYGKPQYGASAGQLSFLSNEDKTLGWYTVTNATLNVRAKPSTSATKRGTLYAGTMVRIESIEGSWGMFYYNGSAAYISLDYADFTSPASYRVAYAANGGDGAPDSATYHTLQGYTVSQDMPVRAGHTFLYWQDGKGNTYHAGDKLPAGDITLTAVWEALPIEESPAPDVGGGSADDDFLFGGGDDTVNDPVSGVEGNSNRAAARAAAVVVGACSLSAGGAWLWVLLRRREDD